MQFFGGKPPFGIVFDCAMGERIDTVLAMSVLYGLDGKNECRVISVSVTKPSLKSAALAELIGRFYAGAVSAEFAAVGRQLPVGMATSGKLNGESPMYEVTESFPHGINRLNDTADPMAVIRNALTSQYDDSCAVVLAGPATNLANTLGLPGAREWAAKKARFLVMAIGEYTGKGSPDSYAQADVAALRKVLAEWPTPVIAVGSEIGAELKYPGASIEKDFAWAPKHPVVDAYRAFQRMPYDAAGGEVAAVLHAVRPKEGYFKLSEPGTITVSDDGRTKFTPGASGKHRHLIFDPAQRDKLVQTMTEIASAKPVVRQRRRRPPDQQQQQTPPPKPPANTP